MRVVKVRGGQKIKFDYWKNCLMNIYVVEEDNSKKSTVIEIIDSDRIVDDYRKFFIFPGVTPDTANELLKLESDVTLKGIANSHMNEKNT